MSYVFGVYFFFLVLCFLSFFHYKFKCILPLNVLRGFKSRQMVAQFISYLHFHGDFLFKSGSPVNKCRIVYF